MMYSINLEEFMNPAVAWMSHAFFWITVIMVIAVAAAFFAIAVISDGDSKIMKVIVWVAYAVFGVWTLILCTTITEKNSAEKKAAENVFQSIGTIDDWNTYKNIVIIDGTEYAYTIEDNILFMVEAN